MLREGLIPRSRSIHDFFVDYIRHITGVMVCHVRSDVCVLELVSSEEARDLSTFRLRNLSSANKEVAIDVNYLCFASIETLRAVRI